MKKTKVVCTIGPASESTTTLKAMLRAGMDCARLNLSHGTHAWHRATIKKLRRLAPDLPIVADLKGPELRIHLPGPLHVKRRDTLILSGKRQPGAITVSYPRLHKSIKPRGTILVDDGKLRLTVKKVVGTRVHCTARNSAILTDGRKVTVPRVTLDFPFPTREDRKDIAFALREGVDAIALSFVQRKQDVETVRRIVKRRALLIPKIETAEAVTNFPAILAESDGVMIARGDLGVELPPEDVPPIQKRLIRQCNEAAVPVITATQMLESMITNPLPTRAETSDVSNAILDGTDAVMLSGESAIGTHPVEAVRMLRRIALKTEALCHNHPHPPLNTISDYVSHAAFELSRHELVDKLLIQTRTGFSARMLARFRPHKPLIAVTEDARTARTLRLVWGVTPLVKKGTLAQAVKACRAAKLVTKRDLILATEGAAKEGGVTNVLKLHRVEDF